jgi:hypothetical protein
MCIEQAYDSSVRTDSELYTELFSVRTDSELYTELFSAPYAYIHTYIHTCIHIHTDIRIHTYMHTCTCPKLATDSELYKEVFAGLKRLQVWGA